MALRAFDAALCKDAVIDEHDVAAGRALDFVGVFFRLGFTLDDFFDFLDGSFFADFRLLVRPCDAGGGSSGSGGSGDFFENRGLFGSGSFRGLGLGDDFVGSGEDGVIIEFFFLFDDFFNHFFDRSFFDDFLDNFFCRSFREQFVRSFFFGRSFLSGSFVGRVDFERFVFVCAQLVELIFGELFDFKALKENGFEVPKVHIDLVDAVGHLFEIGSVLVDGVYDFIKRFENAFDEFGLGLAGIQVEAFFQAFQVSNFFGQCHVGVLSFSFTGFCFVCVFVL